ncbi:hypothetical protein ACFFHM_20090 [Halalkalibacter kiskunsagensis]|uniref:Uncharacterized protein n=1 Tax=Halalkalibacter kiskunsagensis TaxID=1548599 RepID=A0ABV6KHB9_9BACI
MNIFREYWYYPSFFISALLVIVIVDFIRGIELRLGDNLLYAFVLTLFLFIADKWFYKKKSN